MGYSPWDHKESDTTERLTLKTYLKKAQVVIWKATKITFCSPVVSIDICLSLYIVTFLLPGDRLLVIKIVVLPFKNTFPKLSPRNWHATGVQKHFRKHGSSGKCAKHFSLNSYYLTFVCRPSQFTALAGF